MVKNISDVLKEILNQLSVKNRTRLSNEAGCVALCRNRCFGLIICRYKTYIAFARVEPELLAIG